MAAESDVGYYTLPVIASFEGIDKQVNRSLGSVLGKAGVKGGKDFGRGIADGVKAAEADVKKLAGSYEKLYNKAADQADRMKIAQAGVEELIKKGITSGQRYERVMAAQAKAQRDHTATVRQAKEALAELQAAQKRAADESASNGARAGSGFLTSLRSASAGAASVGGGAASSFAEGFAGSSALLRLGSAGGPIGIALAAAGAIAGGLLWQNVMAGIDAEPARDLIQAKLGIDDGSMAKVANAAGKAYANNFGSSLEENMKAAQLAIQGGLVRDATDPALQGVTEKLEAITQVVDGDLAQTTKSASILLKNGLAKSADEAFDIIARGYQITGDLGGDWLDSIGEYSNGWKNAGLTAQQALALIKQAQDNGVDVTDRSADALREFGRRIAEEGPKMIATIDAIGLNGQAMYDKFKAGGPEAFKAFDQVFDAIRNLQSPVDRNQAAMALLGDTAGDFVDAFAKWDPSQAVADLGSIEGAADRAAHTLGDNTAGSIESAKRALDLAVKDTQRGLASAYGPALAEVADWIKTHQEDIKGFFIGVGDVAIEMSKVVVYAFGTLVGALGDIGGAFGDAFGLILDGAALMEDAFGDPQVAASLREDAQAAYGFGDGLKGMRDRINNDVLPAMDGWKNKLHQTANETDTASDNTGALGSSIKGVGDAINGLPKDVPPWYKQLLEGSGGAPANNPLLGPLGIAGGAGTPGQTTAPSIGGIPLLPSGGGGRGVGINLQIAANNAAASGNSDLWDKVAQAESGGRWDDNNSGGHSTSSGAPRGGLQITDGTWKAFGGEEFAPTANQATKEEQIQVAERIAFTGYNGTKPQGLGAWEAITKGMVPGVTADTAPAAAVSSSSPIATGGVDVRGAHQQIAAVAAAAESMFPGLTVTAGRDDHSQDGGYHPRGEAVDIGGDTASMNALSNYLTQNFAPYLAELIHKGDGVTQNVKDGKLTPAIDMPGSIYSTAQAGRHDDHVHIAIKDDMAAAFQQALGLGPSGVSGLSTTGPQSSSLVSAFGNQYKPGIGAPGYNEYGEPGYYETDPRQIQQAQRGLEDASQRISDADQAVTDSQTALNDAIKERDRIAKLSALERLNQKVDLDKANADVERAQKQADRAVIEAQRSREDQKWAEQDLQDAQQGKFTKASEASKSRSGKGGLDQFGGLGSIAGSFLKETFGLDGSFFPDISNLMPVQMLSAGLNAFAGPLQGLVDGQLGIQQPGWQPGMPVNGVANDTGIGTSNAAFGMPDVAVPPMPPGDQHIGPGGPGAPGPVQNVTIDQSIKGNVGSDPAQLFKARDAGLSRAIPRIPAIK